MLRGVEVEARQMESPARESNKGRQGRRNGDDVQVGDYYRAGGGRVIVATEPSS